MNDLNDWEDDLLENPQIEEPENEEES